MLYVFHGTDLRASVEKAHKLIDSLRAKRPDAAFEQMTADTWNPSALQSHLASQGLFSNKYIVFLNRLSENEEAKEQLPDLIPALHESSNVFIALEGKLNAELKKSFEKNAEKVAVSDVAEKAAAFRKLDFNIFALADAVGSRDVMKAWMIYRQAVDLGQEPEAILGTLFWQIKSMALSAGASSATAAGLSPFVFTKSKRYASNYSPAEIHRICGDLITLYHDGHRGMHDLEWATERFILGLKAS